MNYLIVLCIVLAAVAVFQATKVARYSKNLKEAGEAILIKNEAINEFRHGKNLLNANIADLKMKNNSLREQVSLLVSEVNKIGVKRNEKGQFVSLD
jgi:septal ring factor EnvC (AmiA/AmiB activator)